MDFALQRWKVSEAHDVEKLYFGDELLSPEDLPVGKEVITIVGVDREKDVEDLSTIDLGSYTEERRGAIVTTPEKKPRKNGEDVTLPETPTKFGSSLGSRSVSSKTIQARKAQFRCFLLISLVLGLILLGAISVLALTLYRSRNPVSAAEDPYESGLPEIEKEREFDFSDFPQPFPEPP